MAAISFSGFNNIDFKSVVNIIMQSERQPLTRLQASQKAEQSRLTAYGSLTDTLTKLQDAFSALESPAVFGDLRADSSDTSVLTATATSSATKGTFSIHVTSLARPQVTASAVRQFSDINADIMDGGTFSITQKGVTTNINLTGVTSLAELRDAINAQQTGVKASIINDGSTADTPAKPFRLVLTSTTAGVANAFTVNDQTTYQGGSAGTVLNLSTDATNGIALDTEFEYNGISIKSTSTTVTDAVPGLSLHLLKTGTSTVTVDGDDTSLKAKIEDVVDQFNSFNSFVQGQFKLSEGSNRPPLAGDPLLRTINRQIRTFLTSNHANAGSIHNLSAIGIKLKQTGKLELDDAALEAALTSDPDSVKKFLSEASGFAATIGNTLQSFAGTIDAVESKIKLTIDNYSDRIDTLESRLALREDALTRQFAAADEAISQLNSQANALNALGGQYRLF